ncbi:hypothetical protein CR203_08280 [Salipaludibacillus neizhouensis]|uniref:Uncharacterized protein n=1 Tax=Salipaludibacillus neizhouensis TaxID=885475 RepID=A0A3A9K402_9BACI|nr:hypothetical protein [Salipaludibacillus neizhouensis]RKL67357.1 hypothetical protein CR203_08280 [Salipaludibacillus neizhouensis]
MSTGMWIFLGFIALLSTPILIMVIRDVFGLNSNRFYGVEANKKKRSKVEEAYDNKSTHSKPMPKSHIGNGMGSGPSDHGVN